MPSLPCVVAFSLVDLKTFGPLALRSSPFYLVHPVERRRKRLAVPAGPESFRPSRNLRSIDSSKFGSAKMGRKGIHPVSFRKSEKQRTRAYGTSKNIRKSGGARYSDVGS